MNKNSNTYIIAYAAVMVVIVAAVLSFAALYRPRTRGSRKWGIFSARSARAATPIW